MKIQTRLSETRRTDLGEALPLAQPYVMVADPSSLCNLRCRWCPSGYEERIAATGRPQQVMAFGVFEELVRQASEFEVPFRVLRLYKEGEPLVHPRFADMVRLAKDSGCFRRIDTTTNGFLLNPERNRELVAAGLDQINISVNGITAEQIQRNTGRQVDFEAYVENIRDLYQHRGSCTVYVKSIRETLSEEEQEAFFHIFGEIADRVYLEHLSPAWPDFDVSQSGYLFDEIGNYGQPVENRIACPYLFYTMVVNADGTVSTCIGDWKHHQLTGSIREKTLKAIWQGELQRHYQLEHLCGNRACFELCSVCKVITHGCYDNIDSHAKKIEEDLRCYRYKE